MTTATTDDRETTPEEARAIVGALRASFERGATRPLAVRRRRLDALARLLRDHEEALSAALAADLGKSRDEAFTTEIGFTLAEVERIRRGLRRWTRPRRYATGLAMAPGSATTVLEPLGVALVIAPWNYPVQLTLAPLAGALAAGDTVVVKPSELAPRTAALLADLLPAAVGDDAVRVVTGGAAATSSLLDERFDCIFFTGGERVGRIVARAAAEHLTPTVLELGGKSPAFVDESVDPLVAARRIAWAKFTNAGQTCVAPDYVLATPAAARDLERLLPRVVEGFYGADPQASGDYGRIVDEAKLDRLAGFLGDGELVTGGRVDRADRYLAPTVLRAVPDDAPVMGEEIFGPILPIRVVADAAEAERFVRDRPKPLALYVFSERRDVQRRFTGRTSSGSVGIGVAVAHMAVPGLPFGGVGASGTGAYHGERSVRAFSHEKAVVRKPLRPDTLRLTYPTAGRAARSLVRRMLGGRDG